MHRLSKIAFIPTYWTLPPASNPPLVEVREYASDCKLFVIPSKKLWLCRGHRASFYQKEEPWMRFPVKTYYISADQVDKLFDEILGSSRKIQVSNELILKENIKIKGEVTHIDQQIQKLETAILATSNTSREFG